MWIKAARQGNSGLLREIAPRKTHFPAIGSYENLDCVIAALKPQPHGVVCVRVCAHLCEWADMELANTCNEGDKSGA